MNENKVTAQGLARMKIGCKPKYFRFDTEEAFEASRVNAYKIRRTKPRADRAKYEITCSHKERIIRITLTTE